MGGIKGSTLSDKGEHLPFVGIYVKNKNISTSSNADARFEISLQPGEYQLVIQCLGYKTEEQTVVVKDEWVELNIILRPTIYTLGEIKINSKNEDPAYAIMRKAISMAKFYKYQVDEYSVKAYIKGFFKFKKIPFEWLVKKLDKNKDLDTGKVYLDESICELTFKQPNIYKEKFISVSSSQNEKRPSPARYYNGSFYEPNIGDAISPLSPKAFSYYSFQLEGSYYQGKQQINKIKVTPRFKGDNLFRGHIYILENTWNIHSVNLSVMHEGINFIITQLYTEIQNNVWMPLSQSYVIYGKYLGFGFDSKYQVILNNYEIKINEKLQVPAEIIDEKTEKEKVNEAVIVKSKDEKELENLLRSEKKFTRKDMQKLMKMYEKEEQKKYEEPNVVSNRTVEFDSMAYKHDSTFWATERPILLSEKETNSYRTRDSLVLIENKITANDNLKKNKPTLSIKWFAVKLNMDSTSSIQWTTPLASINYNTVEKWVLSSNLIYTKKFQNTNRLIIIPTGRYSFARKLVSGTGLINYQYGSKQETGSVFAEAGKYISQLNTNNPIGFVANTGATLLFESNFMRIYEKEYYKLGFSQKVTDNFIFSLTGEYANRFMLNNATNIQPFIDWKNNNFTSNTPLNKETANTGFLPHQAFTTQLSLKYYLRKKYFIKNGVKKEVHNTSPELILNYKKGYNEILNSKLDFDFIELNFKYNFKIRGNREMFGGLNVGKFINDNKLSFVDYKHFMGNSIFIQQTVTGYRMLDYYKYSTTNQFVESFIHYQPAKLLFTQFVVARMLGIKENVFVNYLYTPSSNNYMELGYGLDQVFRFLRLEVIATFSDMQHQSFGFRVGFASRISEKFK